MADRGLSWGEALQHTQASLPSLKIQMKESMFLMNLDRIDVFEWEQAQRFSKDARMTFSQDAEEVAEELQKMSSCLSVLILSKNEAACSFIAPLDERALMTVQAIVGLAAQLMRERVLPCALNLKQCVGSVASYFEEADSVCVLESTLK